jgi:hypothetical protein
MNKEKLERANKIIRTIETLDSLNSLMYVPYPQFSSHDRNVNSACFDDNTLKALKEVIINFIAEHKAKLKEEFEEL